jgi:hypothetical protein
MVFLMVAGAKTVVITIYRENAPGLECGDI